MTVLDALEPGPEPAPRIIRRVAVQLGLAPPQNGHVAVTGLRRWSTAAPKPVTVPPGRSAVVQSNFLMRHCEDLVPRQRLLVNRAIVVSYRSSGRVGTQEIQQPSARILLTRGPTIRACGPVRNASSVVARGIVCAVARKAAIGCSRLPHRWWGPCLAAGRAWNCTATGPPDRRSVESCWLDSKVQSFKVRWR